VPLARRRCSSIHCAASLLILAAGVLGPAALGGVALRLRLLLLFRLDARLCVALRLLALASLQRLPLASRALGLGAALGVGLRAAGLLLGGAPRLLLGRPLGALVGVRRPGDGRQAGQGQHQSIHGRLSSVGSDGVRAVSPSERRDQKSGGRNPKGIERSPDGATVNSQG